MERFAQFNLNEGDRHVIYPGHFDRFGAGRLFTLNATDSRLLRNTIHA
jgi:hypothetical protein